MSIELPKDADGRDIPLDTEVLYDKEGKRREVDWYTFYPDKDIWDVVLADSSAHFSPHNLSLTQPDSWEKLEEDLSGISKGSACHYFHKGVSNTCEGCPAAGTGSCWPTMARDIKSRIRKLRCEDE